jgi:hypothetical protein
MTNTNRITMKQANEMVGCAVFHDGEHGEIVAARMMAQPMLVVRFANRTAILKVTEIGAR